MSNLQTQLESDFQWMRPLQRDLRSILINLVITKAKTKAKIKAKAKTKTITKAKAKAKGLKGEEKVKKRKSNSNRGSFNDLNKLESTYNTSNPSKNQVYSFLMGSYFLKFNNSNSKKEFNSDSDSLVKLNPFFHENKVNRPKKKREK